MPSASSLEPPNHNTPRSRSPQDELVPIQRVARVLKLHPATVRAMYRRGDFPRPVNIGARKILFSRRSLDAWYGERLGGQVDPVFPLD
jgi:predicted DNA-binding transcriptional regulator AlpA